MEFESMTADGSSSDASVGPASVHAVMPDEYSIACYEHEVPPFAEAEMERLYGHIYSSLIQFKIYGGLTKQTHTYVVRKGGEIVTLFLFRRENGQVEVMNQSIMITGEDILRFARHIFVSHKSVKLISFHAVRTEALTLPFPHQRFNCTDDIVLNLPDTAEAYLASLGKNTRRNIKRYMERLRQRFPSFRYDCYVKDAADEEHVRAIIGFNRARMAGKNKVSTLDAVEEERIVALSKACGLVGVATIDGRVCAGGIAYRCGDNYFLYVIAHDPQYDDYWIGILCCYLTICECIARQGKAFHFLWGRYEYKFTLGAVLRQLDHVVIYRSRMQFLLHAKMALRIAFSGYLHQAKFGLLEKARQRNGPAARMLSRSFDYLRRVKRLVDGLLQRHA